MSTFFDVFKGCSGGGFDAAFRFAASGDSMLDLLVGFFFVGDDGRVFVWLKVYPRPTNSSFWKSGSSSALYPETISVWEGGL
jgi:hypothetical protein